MEIFTKIGEWLGCSEGQAKGVVGGFLMITILGVYLAVSAALELSSDYRLSDEAEFVTDDTTNPADLARERLRERAKLPVVLDEGQEVPDAPPRPNGVALRCGPLLQGQSGLNRGWLWTEEERRCRRVATQPR